MYIVKQWRVFFLLAILVSCALAKEGSMQRQTETVVSPAATSKSGNSYYHFSIAQLLASKGDIDGAIEEYNKAIQLDPKSPALYVDIATLYIKKGDNNTALENLQNAVKIAKDYVPAYLLLGNVYAVLKRDIMQRQKAIISRRWI